MSVLQGYKCPCCGGAIEFDSATQNMTCPYCDTEFDVQTLVSFDQEVQQDTPDELNWVNTGGSQWDQAEQEGLRSYVCSSCGGEVVGDANTAATQCPFCGNPVLVPGQFSGDLRPDLVIPFQLDKEAAKAALRKHCKGKPLLPKAFRDENHLDEIKGIYVPFWLFDAEVDANIRYKATKIRTWTSGDYIHTETRYYAVRRSGSLGFARVPVDGSSKMEDMLMESIEPYDSSRAEPFHTAYLSGYLADKYDVDAQQSIQRANDRIRRSTEDAFAETVVGYSTVTPETSGIRLHNGDARYALYPVWLLNTTWREKRYTFAVNGQSGRLAGNLPLDKGALVCWLLGITAVGGLIAWIRSSLFWLALGLAAALITVFLMWGQLRSVRSQRAADSYRIPGSFRLTEARDLFLYRHVTRRPKPKPSQSKR